MNACRSPDQYFFKKCYESIYQKIPVQSDDLSTYVPESGIRYRDKKLHPTLSVGCSYLSLPSLQWRHNGHDSVSNHQQHDCLFKCLFRRRSKKTSKLRVTGLCTETGEFPAQMASNAENISIWWRHHIRDLLLAHRSSFVSPSFATFCLLWIQNSKHECTPWWIDWHQLRPTLLWMDLISTNQIVL